MASPTVLGTGETKTQCLPQEAPSRETVLKGGGEERRGLPGRGRSRGRGEEQPGGQRGLELRVQVPAWWKRSQGPRAGGGAWPYKGKPREAAGRQDQACVLDGWGSECGSDGERRGWARGRPRVTML